MTDPTSSDYPAAHSMDTTWFAVDSDGAVGVFRSGEPGLVPASLTGQNDDGELELALDRLPLRGEASFDLGAVWPPGLRRDAFPLARKVPLPRSGDRVALVSRDGRAAEQAFGAFGARRKTVDGFCVVEVDGGVSGSGDPRVEAWRAAFAAVRQGGEAFAECFIDARELAWARAGLFVYDIGVVRLNDADPYGRMLVPTSPLRASDLGAHLAARLERSQRLPISFAKVRYVQPAEHVPCVGWSTGIYLASDGFTIRPLAGGSVDYEGSAWTAADADDDARFVPLVFDPPLESADET